jgi:hypothetical protein
MIEKLKQVPIPLSDETKKSLATDTLNNEPSDFDSS